VAPMFHHELAPLAPFIFQTAIFIFICFGAKLHSKIVQIEQAVVAWWDQICRRFVIAPGIDMVKTYLKMETCGRLFCGFGTNNCRLKKLQTTCGTKT
jgi:hypothetical protein